MNLPNPPNPLEFPLNNLELMENAFSAFLGSLEMGIKIPILAAQPGLLEICKESTKLQALSKPLL